MKSTIVCLVGLSFAIPIRSEYGKTHFVIDSRGNPVKNHVAPDILSQQHPHTCHVFFSPADDIRTRLISFIEHEKKSIKISIFMFTDKDIAQALINAAKRGVAVTVIVDGDACSDRFSKIDMLKRSGIDVLEYKPQTTGGISNDIMHHKFVIFESNQDNCSLLWTGSCNFTRSASTRNRENVIVLDDKNVIKQFEQEFDQLKQIIKKPIQFRTGKMSRVIKKHARNNIFC